MRLARRQRGGRIDYPESTERDLTNEVPTRPAAVLLHSNAGFCTALALDFDAHDRTTEQIEDVAYDLFQAEAILDQLGAVYVSDRAHGGAHLYVLLEHPMRFLEARELVEAMALRWPTLDPSPHQSIARGCITIPGSAHRLGGHRELASSPSTLKAVAAGARTSTATIARVRAWLQAEIHTVRTHRAPKLQITPREATTHHEPGVGNVMGAHYQDLAATGDYTAHNYRSPSEARAAVLMSARAAGLSREDVAARMSDGRWPGLWQLHSHRHKPWALFAQEWDRIERDYHPTPHPRQTPARTSDTSANLHRGADTHGHIRAWRSTLHRVETSEFPGAPGWSRRLLLRALAKQSHETGSTITATGIRGLSLATGLSIETVATLLRELSTAPDPWIQRLSRAHGRHAATYALRLPDRHHGTAERTAWVTGKAHAIRPVFERLGAPAALVYEAIEQLPSPGTAEIQLRTGLGRNTVREALANLAGWHLISGDHEGWTLSSTDDDLERLAERFGILQTRAKRIALFREHRRIWWAYLARYDHHSTVIELSSTPEIDALLDQMRLDALDPPATEESHPRSTIGAD